MAISAEGSESVSTVVSCLRYRDAPAAIDSLCRVFGFERHLVVVDGPDNTIAHAELRLGNGTIMPGSVNRDTEFGKLMKQPDEITSRNA